MKRRKFLGLLLATPALGLTGCAFSARMEPTKVVPIPTEDKYWRYYRRINYDYSWKIKCPHSMFFPDKINWLDVNQFESTDEDGFTKCAKYNNNELFTVAFPHGKTKDGIAEVEGWVQHDDMYELYHREAGQKWEDESGRKFRETHNEKTYIISIIKNHERFDVSDNCLVCKSYSRVI